MFARPPYVSRGVDAKVTGVSAETCTVCPVGAQSRRLLELSVRSHPDAGLPSRAVEDDSTLICCEGWTGASGLNSTPPAPLSLPFVKPQNLTECTSQWDRRTPCVHQLAAAPCSVGLWEGESGQEGATDKSRSGRREGPSQEQGQTRT